MKTLLTLLVVPLLAGYLCAQQTEKTETTTTTTWNGTLLDAGCYTTHTKTSETSTDAAGTASRTDTSKVVTECPVTTTTTTFAMATPEGKIVRFDDPSNVRVVEVMKGNKGWTTLMTEKKPIKVRVVGTSTGDVVVVKQIK